MSNFLLYRQVTFHVDEGHSVESQRAAVKTYTVAITVLLQQCSETILTFQTCLVLIKTTTCKILLKNII